MHGHINVKCPNNTSKWQMGFNSAFKWLSVRAKISFRTFYIQLFTTTYFRRFCPPSGRIYKDIYGIEYLGGGLPFSVSTFQYVIHKMGRRYQNFMKMHFVVLP
jgi:hypothetical protein